MSWSFIASTGEQIPIRMDRENRYVGVVDDKLEFVVALEDNEGEMLRLGRLIGRMEKTK